MLIDSQKLRQALIEIKEQYNHVIDRAPKNKVRELFISNIQLIETILIWLHQSEKQGEANMEILKIGLGKTVKLKDIVSTRSKLDAAIIEEAKHLKEMGDARAIDPKAVTISYFKNRVYKLAAENKIPADAKPVQVGDELYIALKPSSKRRQKSAQEVG
jgi:hypothetical protein